VSQEHVSDEPLGQAEIMATLPVLGLRKLPTDQVITATNKEKRGWIFSPTAAVAAALCADKKCSQRLNEYYYHLFSNEPTAAVAWLKSNNNESATAVRKEMGSWEETYIDKASFIMADRDQFLSKSDGERKSQLNKLLQTDGSSVFRKAFMPPTGLKFGGAFDPDAVGYILAANRAIKTGTKPVDTDVVSDLYLDSNFVNDLRGVYYPLKAVNSQAPEIEKIAAVSNGIQSATSDLPVAASVLTREGDAGIGVPLAFSAAENNLRVEPSLLKRYDIYWIQLAISPSEELIEHSIELRYDVTIETPNCLVMDVVPIRVGPEVSTSEKASIPDVKVGEVEVGEMFRERSSINTFAPQFLDAAC
jgi:hypothetical protein